MTKEKFIMSFSGGKDSILALYRMIHEGHEPVALLTTVKKNQEKSWTHGLDNEILYRISKSLDIPLLLVECDVNEYERKFEEALIKAKDMGATMCVFGDIDIEEVYQKIQEEYTKCNHKCQKDSECLAFEYCAQMSCPKGAIEYNNKFFQPEELECIQLKVLYYNTLNFLNIMNQEENCILYQRYLQNFISEEEQ